jgi:glycosyltransferase involved in cell wall biosynthesis
MAIMPPAITVAIPTRNRPRDIERCLDSVGRVTYPNFHVLVIDQSDDDETRIVAERFRGRFPYLRYYRMSKKGLTRARNLALRSTEGEILAFIDDDCTVEPSWLEDVATAFRRYPEVPLIFGQVRPIPHNPKQCFIPGHQIVKERILRGRLAFLQAGSIMGASMYLRSPTCRQLGPFDLHSGPGARFNIEDRDYAYRHLAARYPVLLTPRITVAHHGARQYAHGDTRALLRSYGYGFGAQDMKFLRCGDRVALLIIVGHIIKMLLFIVWRRVLSGRVRGSHSMWIVMYFRGLIAGLRVPVVADSGLWGRLDEYESEDLPRRRTPGHEYPWRTRRVSENRRTELDYKRVHESQRLVQGEESVE